MLQSSGVKPKGCQFILRGHSTEIIIMIKVARHSVGEFFFIYEGWNFNSGNYLFTTDTK